MGTSSRTPPPIVYEAFFGIAVVGIGFQLFHFAEHVAQLAHWLATPEAPAWMSGWALVGADSLAGLGDGARSTGAEYLHLFGNMIFLCGVIGLTLYMRRSTRGSGRMEWLSIACIIQTIHVVEHIALTATRVVGGEAIGFSTAFGTLSGAQLVELRVGFHFLINLLATAATLIYLGTVYSERRSTGMRRGDTAAQVGYPLATH